MTPAMQNTPLLAVRALTKQFPLAGKKGIAVRAVDGVSFSLFAGETLGIVGESGCGKSTLSRLLLNLIEPDQGSLSLDGREVGSAGGVTVKQLRQAMQMVFQDSHSSLNPRMPIRDSVAFGPLIASGDKADARRIAAEMLSRVGLDPALFGARYPHELSGGQKQRVNIARALATHPRIVILDEAVSALDKSVAAQVLNLLGMLKRTLALTYLFISHDLHAVHYVSDRVMVMYLGRVVELGPADSVFAAPKHPYTRALLASRLTVSPRRRIEEAPLSGDPPSPIAPPSGCHFRSRCPSAEAVCATHSPLLPPGSRESHHAACHMHDRQSGHSLAGREDHD